MTGERRVNELVGVLGETRRLARYREGRTPSSASWAASSRGP